MLRVIAEELLRGPLRRLAPRQPAKAVLLLTRAFQPAQQPE